MDLDSFLDKAKGVAGKVWEATKNYYEKSKEQYEAQYEQGKEEASEMSNDELLHRYQRCSAGAYRKALREELESRGIDYKIE